MEQGLRQFDLDADGFISGYEVSRLATQASVPVEAVPSLIRSLRMGPLGIPLDSLVDILTGQGVAVPGAVRASRPPPRPPAPAAPPERLLEVVKEATRRREERKAQLMELLHWDEASLQRQEEVIDLLRGYSSEEP